MPSDGRGEAKVYSNVSMGWILQKGLQGCHAVSGPEILVLELHAALAPEFWRENLRLLGRSISPARCYWLYARPCVDESRMSDAWEETGLHWSSYFLDCR